MRPPLGLHSSSSGRRRTRSCLWQRAAAITPQQQLLRLLVLLLCCQLQLVPAAAQQPLPARGPAAARPAAVKQQLAQPPAAAASVDNCAGTSARVRHLIFYSLASRTPQQQAALAALWRRRQAECASVLVAGSSYGGPVLTTSPAAYGFTPSRPVPADSVIADFVGWLDFDSVEDLSRCIAINNATATLAAMRAFAPPQRRFSLIIPKVTQPGSSRHGPCPFPGSYAPASVRYVYGYLLPNGGASNATAACSAGVALWNSMLAEADLGVRHGAGCSLLRDPEAAALGITQNAGFGGYVDFASLRDMQRFLAPRSRSLQEKRRRLRSLAAYAVRGAIQLPWAG